MFLCFYLASFVISAIVTAGLFFADLDTGSQNKKETEFCFKLCICSGVLFGLLGPLGIFLALLVTGFGKNGWKLK